MGLDIAYETLQQYLADRFDSSTTFSRAIDVVAAEIQRQTGVRPELSEIAPTEQLAGDRYGPYSSLHVLRLYASRIAGYTLEEAYMLPVKQISFNKSREGLEDDDADPCWNSELPEDEQFSQDWGISVNTLVPVSRERHDPFPYQHLVCFSDNEGIYVPFDFPQPFRLDEIYVGSSVHLQSELQDVGRHLVEAILETMKNQTEEREQFLLHVRQLWWALEAPCEKSVRAKTSMIFT